MKQLKEDKFVSNLIGYKSYIASKKSSLNFLNRYKKPFFITYKSKKKTNFNIKNINYKLISNLIFFERKYKKDLPVFVECRKAKKSDLKKLKKIAKEKTSNSRFVKDGLIPNNFKREYRSIWVENFFKKKRGDYLFVATHNKIIFGFIILIKKNNSFIVDLIVSSSSFRKRKAATSLINHVNNNLMKTNQNIIAGTQTDNMIAKNFYKSLGFRKKNKIIYVYHLHSKRHK